MRVSLTFKRHMTLYGTMVCFISLVLKSMAFSYTPDSELILEIAVCSKNKQSLYEVPHVAQKGLHKGCACHLALTYSIFMLLVFST